MIIKLSQAFISLGAGRGFKQMASMAERAKAALPAIKNNLQTAIKPINVASQGLKAGSQEIKTFANQAMAQLQAGKPLAEKIQLAQAAATAKPLKV
mgnify:FL=1